MRGLEAGPDADMLKSLAAGMRANTAGRKDEAAMRRELKAEVEREMRAKLDKAAKTKGFTKGTVDLIFETVLGADG